MYNYIPSTQHIHTSNKVNSCIDLPMPMKRSQHNVNGDTFDPTFFVRALRYRSILQVDYDSILITISKASEICHRFTPRITFAEPIWLYWWKMKCSIRVCSGAMMFVAKIWRASRSFWRIRLHAFAYTQSRHTYNLLHTYRSYDWHAKFVDTQHHTTTYPCHH